MKKDDIKICELMKEYKQTDNSYYLAKCELLGIEL